MSTKNTFLQGYLKNQNPTAKTYADTRSCYTTSRAWHLKVHQCMSSFSFRTMNKTTPSTHVRNIGDHAIFHKVGFLVWLEVPMKCCQGWSSPQIWELTLSHGPIRSNPPWLCLPQRHNVEAQQLLHVTFCGSIKFSLNSIQVV